MKLHTYLNFAGRTEEAFRFYAKAFGGSLTSIVRFRDMPVEGVEIPQADQDKVMHVGLQIGDDLIMGTDTLESLGQKLVVGNNSAISIHPDTKEEADRLFGALSDGGQVTQPMVDAPWGDYFGMFTDKFGIQWMVNYSDVKGST
jgi:PhnB protein